jgi:NitT/TauT family transport system substrate-binding protein
MRKPVLALLALAVVGSSMSSLADDVSIALEAYDQAQSAGFAVALDHGLYANEGLNVTFVEGQAGTDQLDALLEGFADFAVDSPENLLLARQAGDDVIAVAVLYQHNPLVFITKADSGIVRPHDFSGHTAAILSADQNELQFYAMLARLGLDADQVTLLPYEFELGGFFDGSVDITFCTVNQGLIRIRNAGYDVNIIWPGDYGVRMYSDALITTQAMIDEHPDIVERVVRATLLGWEQAVARPEQAVDSILRYAIEPDRTLQREMLLASIPLVAVGTTPIGWMEPEIWSSMIRILADYGGLRSELASTQVYDRQFLEAVYGPEGNG